MEAMGRWVGTRGRPVTSSAGGRLALLAIVLVLAAACAGGDAQDARFGDGDDDGDLAVVVASFDLGVGEDRQLLAGVMTPDRRVIGGGSVDLELRALDAGDESGAGQASQARFLPVPGTGTPDDLDEPVVLGEPASHDHGAEDVEPHDHGDPAAAGVYAATVDFDRPGLWEAVVTAVVDGEERTGTTVFEVQERQQVPDVGDPAPRVRTPTVGSGAPPAAIDSRADDDTPVPDPTLHDVDLAEALDAGRPIVVAFATPTWCTSRFCGPITDTVERLAERYGDRAEFVHVEIWADFERRTLNDPVEPWIGTDDGGNEPWVFLVDADGTIAARWDNVLDEAALVEHLESLPAA